MAKEVSNINRSTFADSFSRTSGQPLDADAIFTSLTDAKNYAAGKDSSGNSIPTAAYVGQYLAVKNGTTYDGYIIIDTNGRLAKLSLLDSENNNNLDKVSFSYTNGSLKITVT